LRRRRYDWAWNATALYASCSHLIELVALGTPFFGLLPEAEPAFVNSALTAISAAGFDLKGIALRTEHDPVQLAWERGERLRREAGQPEIAVLQKELADYLEARGEPASYIHVHAAGMQLLTESHALKGEEQEFDDALRGTHSAIEMALKQDARFIHISTGEGIETGLWGLHEATEAESLTDRAEEIIVRFLQANPRCRQLEVEQAVYGELRGLLTPSMGIMAAILHSYALEEGADWTLRAEDTTASRQQDLRTIQSIIEATGRRLNYKTRLQERWLVWEENGMPMRAFTVRASARVANAMAQNPLPLEECVLVLPGGRAGLIDYKAQRDPAFAERLKLYRLAKYRLWRALREASILTRETFQEQLASDPIERSHGQMIMF
jgi:hypothetical protein